MAAIEAEISAAEGLYIDLRLVAQWDTLSLERSALLKERAAAVRSRLAEVVAEVQMSVERTPPPPPPQPKVTTDDAYLDAVGRRLFTLALDALKREYRAFWETVQR